MTSPTINEHETIRKPEKFGQRVLRWYDMHRRDLPWRAQKGHDSDPYHVWLSEIMLQQTTVPAVIPYFYKFLERWPTIEALAQADIDSVMKEWAGLGYYARARNLYKCSQVVVNSYDGVFPKDIKALRGLPGIGDYTSAAIMAIAYNQKACVVDGNVERVMARFHAVDTPLPQAKRDIKEYAAIYTNALSGRYGDYAQGLMDLGAAVCRPKSPLCGSCPVSSQCQAYAQGKVEACPKRLAKASKPHKFGLAYIIEDDAGNILMHKRPDHGLLGGLYGFPTSSWESDVSDCRIDCNVHGFIFNEDRKGVEDLPYISHVFTHFTLTLYVQRYLYANEINNIADGCIWVSKKELPALGLPSLFAKVQKLLL
ncbi:MAG: A/G-specific adenine glycosylase [Alphaproteobacteria bacterium]